MSETDFPAIIPGGGDLAAFLAANKGAVDAALTDAGAPIYTASAEFYAAMINTFADNVADRLQ